jgi:toxin ParE1/3/4
MAARRRTVVWTRNARSGLDGILNYVAEGSPLAARRLLLAVLVAAESLGELTERGRVVPEIGDPAVREIFAYSYRLLYRVGLQQVDILGVLHGARDFHRWRRRD